MAAAEEEEEGDRGCRCNHRVDRLPAAVDGKEEEEEGTNRSGMDSISGREWEQRETEMIGGQE